MTDFDEFAGRILRRAAPGESMTPYEAGYDCGMRGANTTNCHFSIFSCPANTADWERGKADAERAKEAHPNG